MTQEETKVIINGMVDGVKCATDCVFETLSMLFEEMSKHPELNLQQTLLAISIGLKGLVGKKEKGNE